MIRKIGIICQGPNDKGFLDGLRERLGCQAELMERFDPHGKNRISKRRDNQRTVSEFLAGGAQLVVRLTDSDDRRWQEVRREEIERFPDVVRSMLVCGVTEGCVELWLAGDRGYLEQRLGIPAMERVEPRELVGQIKHRIKKITGESNKDYDEFIREWVVEAPESAFQQWLRNDAFRTFYGDCRNAAIQEADCRPLNDELRES